MTRWCAEAPGKINLCLFVGEVRADGRHQLVTLFESVSLADDLSVSAAECDSVVCPGVEGPNLAGEAVARLRDRGWDAPPLRIEIAKRVPTAAGMGGGSADAAAMLRIAGEIAPIDRAIVEEIAAELGSDVPAQLAPGLAIGTGAGDAVDPRPPLPAHAIVIVPSAESLSTADVYREADRLGPARSRAELERLRSEVDRALAGGGRLPSDLLVNDLEPAAASLCPAVEEALIAARHWGGDDVIVCGSGPTVAAIFWGDAATEVAAEAATSLQSRFPGTTVAEPVPHRFGIPRIA